MLYTFDLPRITIILLIGRISIINYSILQMLEIGIINDNQFVSHKVLRNTIVLYCKLYIC